MAIAYGSLTSGSGVTDGGSFSTASVTPSSNNLVLLAVYSGDVSGNASDPPTSVTGNGLTWVQVNQQDIDASFDNISVWRTLGASPSSGIITMNWADDQDWAAWSVTQYSGVDTSGTNGSGAIVQSAVNSGTATTLTATLGAFGSVDNATYGAFGNYRDLSTGTDVFTEGTGFTKAHEVALAVGWRETLGTQYLLGNDTSEDGSFDNTDNNGVVAIEIKAAVGGSSSPKGPFGHPFNGPFGGPV